MSLFIIVSVVFVCLTIFESIIVFKAYLIVQEREKRAGVEAALGRAADGAGVGGPGIKAGGAALLASARERLPHLIYRWMDPASLVVFPILYAIAIALIFHWNGGG